MEFIREIQTYCYGKDLSVPLRQVESDLEAANVNLSIQKQTFFKPLSVTVKFNLYLIYCIPMNLCWIWLDLSMLLWLLFIVIDAFCHQYVFVYSMNLCCIWLDMLVLILLFTVIDCICQRTLTSTCSMLEAVLFDCKYVSVYSMNLCWIWLDMLVLNVLFIVIDCICQRDIKIPVECLTVTAVMGNVATDVAPKLFNTFLQYYTVRE